MRKLDEEVMTGQNVFVYPVQNVEAESIAAILNSLYVTGSSSGTKTVARKTTSTTAKKTTAKRTISSPVTQPSSSRIEIITFEPTNSLVILAPPGLYREMVKTIKRVDVYPREVLIEAVIAEVTLSDSEKLGIQWAALGTAKALLRARPVYLVYLFRPGVILNFLQGLPEGLHIYSSGPISWQQ